MVYHPLRELRDRELMSFSAPIEPIFLYSKREHPFSNESINEDFLKILCLIAYLELRLKKRENVL